MKRILLFILTNIAVIAAISIMWFIVSSVFGLGQIQSKDGLNLTSLMVFSVLVGFTGSFISLMMSKWMAKRSVGAVVIEQPGNSTEVWLMETVRRQANAAGINMPEVAIYDSPEINAFATGPSRNNALVAVSTGLLNYMNRDEAEAVMAHEIGHVANGDMVTMTLVQGVVNAFTMFLARVLAFFVAQFFRRGDEEGGGVSHLVYFVATLVFDIAFSILGSFVVAWFSRLREFRADAGGARIAGRDRMIGALEALQRTSGIVDPSDRNAAVQTLKISGHPKGLMRLLSTHPPLETRIARLKMLA